MTYFGGNLILFNTYSCTLVENLKHLEYILLSKVNLSMKNVKI